VVPSLNISVLSCDKRTKSYALIFKYTIFKCTQKIQFDTSAFLHTVFFYAKNKSKGKYTATEGMESIDFVITVL
jgi:hypothetical protein